MGNAIARKRNSNEKGENFDVHANQITQWKTQLQEAATGVFLTPTEKRESVGPSVKDMQAKIGQLALENDFSYGPRCQVGQKSISQYPDEVAQTSGAVETRRAGRLLRLL